MHNIFMAFCADAGVMIGEEAATAHGKEAATAHGKEAATTHGDKTFLTSNNVSAVSEALHTGVCMRMYMSA